MVVSSMLAGTHSDREDDEDISELELSVSGETDRSHLSDSFSFLGVLPLKVHAQPDSTKLKTGQRKLESAVTALTQKVARTLNVPQEEFKSSEISKYEEMLEKAAAFDASMLRKREYFFFQTLKEAGNSQVPQPTWSIFFIMTMNTLESCQVKKTMSASAETNMLRNGFFFAI